VVTGDEGVGTGGSGGGAVIGTGGIETVAGGADASPTAEFNWLGNSEREHPVSAATPNTNLEMKAPARSWCIW
jgi:hypothetical protein